MIPFVLSGGSGTRLWPVSREAFPKQFCELFDGSLLGRTLERLAPLATPGEDVGVVGAARTEALTRRVLREAGLGESRALFEPLGRNTAPAVALLCHRLLQEGRGPEVVGSFHADHRIDDEATFHRAVRLAERVAGEGQVVTLGILPSGPETGYGYIELTDEVVAVEEPGSALGGQDGPGGREDGGAPPDGTEPLRAYRVLGFREKPDPQAARRYVESGRFVWNAGMFVFRVEDMAQHFQRLMPALWERIRTIRPDLGNLEAVYREVEPESLDYGIMERLDDQVSIPCDIGWSDVGSWDEVARLRDGGAAHEVGGDGSFVFSANTRGERVYGLVGVDDLLVVDTDDALLVARRGDSQRVKELVEALRRADRPEAREHAFDVRPWGRYEVLRDGEDFKSKVIRVEPGRRLSYQSHEHRAEHWVVVRGRAEVVLDGEVLHLGRGEHVFIPQGARHRIGNPGTEPVVFVEVQIGDYFGEDDIVRYDDDFGRS